MILVFFCGNHSNETELFGKQNDLKVIGSVQAPSSGSLAFLGFELTTWVMSGVPCCVTAIKLTFFFLIQE